MKERVDRRPIAEVSDRGFKLSVKRCVAGNVMPMKDIN
jgi:hypothetical protein